MEYKDKQLLMLLAWALRDHAMIVSGAYKLRKTEKGVEGGGWRPCTDEEKLEDSMSTLTQRCHWISELIEK